MIDPAHKPVQAQQAKPVVKPATIHSLPKRAWLVFPTYPEVYSIHIFPVLTIPWEQYRTVSTVNFKFVNLGFVFFFSLGSGVILQTWRSMFTLNTP